MIDYNKESKELKIIIPINSLRELYAYQKGVLGLLNEIELDKCNLTRKKDIKQVYELLSHLYIESEENLVSN